MYEFVNDPIFIAFSVAILVLLGLLMLCFGRISTLRENTERKIDSYFNFLRNDFDIKTDKKIDEYYTRIFSSFEKKLDEAKEELTQQFNADLYQKINDSHEELIGVIDGEAEEAAVNLDNVKSDLEGIIDTFIDCDLDDKIYNIIKSRVFSDIKDIVTEELSESKEDMARLSNKVEDIDSKLSELTTYSKDEFDSIVESLHLALSNVYEKVRDIEAYNKEFTTTLVDSLNKFYYGEES
jgi:hemoglobin-like flavoprotein